jgi:hypothetical protein
MVSEWVVAGAEIALACGTVWLGWQAYRQVNFQREQAAAETEPVVVPAPLAAWSEISASGPLVSEFRVKNAGPGVALNVKGRIEFAPGGSPVELVPSSLGPGDVEDLRINWPSASKVRNWSNATGRLWYEDIVGGRWETDFNVYIEGQRRYVNVRSRRRIKLADGTVVV